ncbi:retrovirus-related pol polyprotein from transposon TNT 1-94 [Tanacetum coccineum]
MEMGEKKLTWINWKKTMARKEDGGLGIGSLYGFNMALLYKWKWRFRTTPDALWVKIIKNIFGHDGGLLASRLDTKMNAMVNARINLSLESVCLRRRPRGGGGGAESDQWNQLLSLLKTASHVFLRCEFSLEIWRQIARWWDLDIPHMLSMKELLGWVDNLKISKIQKKGKFVEWVKSIKGRMDGSGIIKEELNRIVDADIDKGPSFLCSLLIEYVEVIKSIPNTLINSVMDLAQVGLQVKWAIEGDEKLSIISWGSLNKKEVNLTFEVVNDNEYLRGTFKLGITFENGKLMLVGFTDLDMAGNKDNMKSTSGYLMTFAGGAVSWQSRLQKYVALSTTEAEYMTATEACKELLTKHIDIRYHWIRDAIEDGMFELNKVHTDDNASDMLTKAVAKEKLKVCCWIAGMANSSS